MNQSLTKTRENPATLSEQDATSALVGRGRGAMQVIDDRMVVLPQQ